MSKSNLQEGAVSLEELVEGFTLELPDVEDDKLEIEETVQEKEEEESTTEEKKPTEATTEKEEKEEEDTTDTSKVDPPTKQSKFLDIAKVYLEKGKWQDVVIEDGEGNEVTLSELSELDEDTFFQIQESQEKLSQEDLEENYISLKEKDERTKQLANILLKGGDLAEIFKSQENLERYINPYKGIDLDNESVQEQVYYNYLTKTKGNDPEVAQIAIERAKKDLTLDTKAKTIVENTNKAFEQYVKSKEAEVEKAEAERRQQEAEFKKSLLKVFKDTSIKESTARRYADLATKKDKDGDYAIDSLYNETMQDPEKAADLIAFLDNKEEYLKRYTGKARTEITKDNLKKIKVIKSKSDSRKTEDKDDKFELDLPIVGMK